MKITCKLNTYSRHKKYKTQHIFTIAKEWEEDNPDYEIEYRLEIETIPKKDRDSTVLVSKIINRRPEIQKREYIDFCGVGYMYFHDTNAIYCYTLEQKV